MGAAIVAALGALLVAGITYASNKDLQNQSQDYNIQMLEQQNEYNKPENQIQRMKDAGINPSSLAMGNGQVMRSDSASSLPLNQFPTDFSMIGQFMNQLSNSKLQFSQAKTEDLLREERYNNLKLQNSHYIANIEKLGVDTRSVQIANEYAAAMSEVSLMKSKTEIGLNLRQWRFMDKEVEKMVYELEKVLPQEVRESESRTALNLLSQEEVVAKIENYFHQNANLDADTALKTEQKGLVSEQVETEQERQEQLNAETQFTEKSTEDLQNAINLYLATYDDQVTEIASRAKISKKQASWFIVNMLMGNAQSAAITAGSGAVAAKAIKTLVTSPAKIGF